MLIWKKTPNLHPYLESKPNTDLERHLTLGDLFYLFLMFFLLKRISKLNNFDSGHSTGLLSDQKDQL